MKRVFCILLTVMLLCSISACGTPTDLETTDKPSITVGSQPQKETTEPTETIQKGEENMEVFQFPTVEIYCKVPENMGRKTEGRVAVATGNDAYIATVCCKKNSDFSGKPEDVLAYHSEIYANSVGKYLSPDVAAKELKASTTEKVTVSGYEAVKFSGPVTNTDGGTYQIYGYSMIIEEMPVMFLGILRSKDQALEDLNAMKALVDQMAGSIFKR